MADRDAYLEIPFKYIVGINYNVASNVCSIQYERYDNKDSNSYEAVEEFEDVFLPPLHETLREDSMYKEV